MKHFTILTLVLLFFGIKLNAEPIDVNAYRKSSVRIYNKKMTNGGSGAILKSSDRGSKILTNKHICRIIEQGGVVVRDEESYDITHYKKFSDHDLCLIYVKENLKVETKISSKLSKPTDIVYVSGHPNLLPHIVTEGHLTDNMIISLIVGVKPCKKTDMKIECIFFGGIPMLQDFESQVVSNLIKPGSSGSAVFNTDKEIVGVVFAGSGRDFSHGFIVPQKYVLYFMATADLSPATPVGTEVNSKGLSGRVFNYSACRKPTNENIKKTCNKIQDNLIWSKTE